MQAYFAMTKTSYWTLGLARLVSCRDRTQIQVFIADRGPEFDSKFNEVCKLVGTVQLLANM